MNNDIFPNIEQAQIDAYNKDGVVILRNALTAPMLTELRTAIASEILNPGPYYHGYATKGSGKFHGNMRLWENNPSFRNISQNSHLPDIAQQFLGSTKVNLFYDQLFVKEAGTPIPTRWHNDLPYWPIRGSQTLSFWFAGDKSTRESGVLEFIRGSHLWDRYFQPEVFGKTRAIDAYEKNPDYEPMPDIENHRDDYDIIHWDLEPGDALLFHGLTVHGAAGNTSQALRRRGYAIRYTGDDVVYDAHIGTNKHLSNDTLADGDPLDSDQYPRVRGLQACK